MVMPPPRKRDIWFCYFSFNPDQLCAVFHDADALSVTVFSVVNTSVGRDQYMASVRVDGTSQIMGSARRLLADIRRLELLCTCQFAPILREGLSTASMRAPVQVWSCALHAASIRNRIRVTRPVDGDGGC
jgi:hypothetical protein